MYTVSRSRPFINIFLTQTFSQGRPVRRSRPFIDLFLTQFLQGRPKGAAGSHRNFTSCPFHNNVAPLRNYLRKGEAIPLPDPNAPQQTGICTLPLFHVGGLHGALQAYTMSGTRIITLNKFDAGVVVRAIEKYRVTGIGTVPTIVWAIIEHPE